VRTGVVLRLKVTTDSQPSHSYSEIKNPEIKQTTTSSQPQNIIFPVFTPTGLPDATTTLSTAATSSQSLPGGATKSTTTPSAP